MAVKTRQKQERRPIMRRPRSGAGPVRVGVTGPLRRPRPAPIGPPVHRPRRVGIGAAPTPQPAVRRPVTPRFEGGAVVRPPVETAGRPDRRPVTHPRRLGSAPAQIGGGIKRPVTRPASRSTLRLRDTREPPRTTRRSSDIGVAGTRAGQGHPPRVRGTGRVTPRRPRMAPATRRLVLPAPTPPLA